MPEFKSLKEIYFGLKDYSWIVKEKTSSFKRFLKRNLIRDQYIDREEDQKIIQNLDKKFLTIYGDANTGKSSVIYNLCDYFDKSMYFLRENVIIFVFVLGQYYGIIHSCLHLLMK